ncbi:MAG: hypothetical protein FH749_05815 [Firmicutes bacterium]|nr:hypothetical protein [Bacillota bacterium]
MTGFNLYLRFIRLNFLANLQYKGWPLQMAMVLSTVISDPIAVFLLFARFGNIGARFHVHRLSRVVGGLFMIGWALARLEIVLRAPTTILLVFALVGGYAIYTGVFIISAAISFWTINALDWIYIFTNISYQITKCPPQLLPAWLKNTFLYIMPMLAFAYWPAAAIGGWDGVSPALGWLALPVGLAFLATAIMV